MRRLLLLLLVSVSACTSAHDAPSTVWEYGWTPSPGERPTDWRSIDAPWVEQHEGSADVWFRHVFADGAGDEGHLFVGFMNRPFEVFVGDRRVFRHEPKWSSGVPMHLVRIGAVPRGQVLSLHTWVPWRRYAGFRFGVVVGSVPEIYESLFREGGAQFALGLVGLVIALMSLGCQFVLRPRARSPFLVFAAFAGVSGLQFVARSPISHVLFAGGVDLGWLGFVLMPLIPAFEALYVAAVLPRPPIRLLRALAGIFFIEAAVMVVGDLVHWASFAQTAYLHELLESGFALVMLVVVLDRLRSGDPLSRVGLVGYLVYRGFALYEVIFAFRNDYAPHFVAQYGFAGLLVFLFASMAFAAHLENRARSEARVRDARARAVAETTQMFAHDVRRPLSLVRAVVDQLARAEGPPEMKAMVRDVRSEVDDATRSIEVLINDILEVGAQAPLSTGPAEVTELLASTLRHFFSRPTRRYSVGLRYDLQHARKWAVDAAQVERVLVNIVGNALEAMDGTGELWFRTRGVSRRGRPFIELTLGNSGSHIDEADLPHLFEAFFTTGKPHGTGLGLAIVHKIVTAHGGEVSCRSDPARGVELVVSLPEHTEAATPGALPSSADGFALAPVPAPASPSEDTRPLIVLVEDSRAMQRAWTLRLPDARLRVFGNPSQLRAAAEQDARLWSDAVCFILDNRFEPGETLGEEFAAELRGRTAAPIFLFSDDHFEGRPAGVDACLPKEVLALGDLLRLVATAVWSSR